MKILKRTTTAISSGIQVAVGETIKGAKWALVRVVRTTAWLGAKAMVPIMLVRDRIPGAHYVIDAFGIILGLNFVILPAVTLVATIGYGIGYAIFASAISIPTYAMLLATSLAPWKALGISSLTLAGIWWGSHLLSRLINRGLVKDISGLEEVPLAEAIVS